MRFTKKLGALLCSAAIASIMVVPAAPALAEGEAQQAIPTVNKTLQVNNGSSVTATFKYTATPVEINIIGSDGQPTGAKTYTDGPEDVSISDVAITAENANATGTGYITFGGETDASKFAHAGVYAWKIVETTGTYPSSSVGEMQYDPQVYTLIATVENDDSATAAANKLKLGNFYVVKGEATQTKNDESAKADLNFTNTYTEKTTENGTDLVINKVVTGAQGDKTKKFDFEVTFKAPTYLPAGKTANNVLDEITATPTGATDVAWKAAAADGSRTITFKAANSESVKFTNVVAGTTYTVKETDVTGYTKSYSSVSNGGAATSASENVLIGENANTGTMTNDYTSVSPTGILINNLPYVLLIGVPLIALAAWFVMRRKRAYQD